MNYEDEDEWDDIWNDPEDDEDYEEEIYASSGGFLWNKKMFNLWEGIC